MAQAGTAAARAIQGQTERTPAYPHVPSVRLHGVSDCYKVKLRSVGYRLVYQVEDKTVLVTVIAVGRRDKGLVYSTARKQGR